jgi:hypothetical protein
VGHESARVSWAKTSFATGINPADYAQWAGEDMFLSKDAARPGGNFVFNMLMQGYRWAGQGAWHFWVGNDIINNWNSMKPRAVFRARV